MLVFLKTLPSGSDISLIRSLYINKFCPDLMLCPSPAAATCFPPLCQDVQLPPAGDCTSVGRRSLEVALVQLASCFWQMPSSASWSNFLNCFKGPLGSGQSHFQPIKLAVDEEVHWRSHQADIGRASVQITSPWIYGKFFFFSFFLSFRLGNSLQSWVISHSMVCSSI